MRKMVARAADTAGNVVQVEWNVRDDQTDGHADAHGVVLGLYDQLVGDAPQPVSMEITTTFYSAPRGVTTPSSTKDGQS